jgi:hypothetical protein
MNWVVEAIRKFFTQPPKPREYHPVDIPDELAWVSKVAYRQGYDEGDEPRAENRYAPGTLEHESWRLGAERRVRKEMNVW